jgi:hypothetical protein
MLVPNRILGGSTFIGIHVAGICLTPPAERCRNICLGRSCPRPSAATEPVIHGPWTTPPAGRCSTIPLGHRIPSTATPYLYYRVDIHRRGRSDIYHREYPRPLDDPRRSEICY